MTLIAHAIAAAPPTEVSDGGLRGRPLAWTEALGLGVWCTQWESGLELGRADALEHHRVVERICATQPCLPVRFGTSFESAEDARQSLEKKGGVLRSALERVSGKAELALTLLWRDAPAPAAATADAGPGRRFLEERRVRYAAVDGRKQRAEAMVAELVDALAIDRALVWHATCMSEGVAVSLAVLVPIDRALAQKTELERLGSHFEDVVAVVNGPWPPYTFARVE